jgi:PHP family Zn ribbon phosphoesterase
LAAKRKSKEAQKQSSKEELRWRRVDLHLHTPASVDFQEQGVTYLDILQKGETRGLDIIAFTDHNSIAGYAAMLSDIEQLELLERLGRLRADEKKHLDEYRRLRQKVLVLPAFEFTATFGFHILAIFPETTSVREIEHILLTLHVPADKLDEGSGEVGATSDVLTAYRVIDEAGGLVIAAHANSTHGVATIGALSGQTKIAYTQDERLHALEVTDLESKSKRSTAAFFNGSKPEYPRRMHCIQSSDSHRLVRDLKNPKNLGVGDRVTEVLLPQVSFTALKELFQSRDFARSRPYRPTQAPFDHVRAAREEGNNIVQSFHTSYTQRGGKLYAIIADVCAFANTNGGTIYVGLSDDPKARPTGVDNANKAIETLRSSIQQMITPLLQVSIDAQQTEGVKVVRLIVPRGDEAPYAIDDNKVYVRNEAETNLAVRDEIVQLVRRSLGAPVDAMAEAAPGETEAAGEAEPIAPSGGGEPSLYQDLGPRTGVEIVSTEEREGTRYHTMRDLRNGSIVKNVTRKSARKLWHYAITQHESQAMSADQIAWRGDLAMLESSKRAGKMRYDLVQRLPDGSLRVYYGVTEDGIHGEWKKVVGLEE